jgi:hypothetical protein
MDEINEIDELKEFRADTAPMSARAHFRGHQRLSAEIAAPTRRGLRRPTRRALVAAGVVMAVTGGIIGTQIAGPSGTDTSAQAVSVLNLAADALDTVPETPPRPDQFQYIDVVHVTSDPNDKTRYQQWMSVTGKQTGLGISVGDYNHTGPIDPYQPGTGLMSAPYDVIAALPTDPAKLLKVLAQDQYVRGDIRNNHTDHNVAVWGLMRFIVEGAPNAQQAAIFRAAASIPHMAYSPDATDADGRHGEAVGLEDPRLGFIQFIFDKNTHRFLGERVLGSQHTTSVEFNDTVRTVAFVDKPGQLPS